MKTTTQPATANQARKPLTPSERKALLLAAAKSALTAWDLEPSVRAEARRAA